MQTFTNTTYYGYTYSVAYYYGKAYLCFTKRDV